MQQGRKIIENTRVIDGTEIDHKKLISHRDEVLLWLYEHNSAVEQMGGMNLRIFRQKWYPQGEVTLKRLEQDGFIVVQRFATGAFNYKLTEKGARHANALGDESQPGSVPD